jgi:hypothetical protein
MRAKTRESNMCLQQKAQDSKINSQKKRPMNARNEMMAVAMLLKCPKKVNLSTMTLECDASNQVSAHAVGLVDSAVTEHARAGFGQVGALGRSEVMCCALKYLGRKC